jgi:hypothetical protein
VVTANINSDPRDGPGSVRCSAVEAWVRSIGGGCSRGTCTRRGVQFYAATAGVYAVTAGFYAVTAGPMQHRRDELLARGPGPVRARVRWSGPPARPAATEPPRCRAAGGAHSVGP